MNQQTDGPAASAGAPLDERLRRRLATYATAGPAATHPWDTGDARRTTWPAIEPAAPPAAAAPVAELPRTLPELPAERTQHAWPAWQGYAEALRPLLAFIHVPTAPDNKRWQGYAQALRPLLAGFAASFGGVFAVLLLLAHVRA